MFLRQIWAPCWLKQESAGPNCFLGIQGSEVNAPQMAETTKSPKKIGPLSFLLGVQFFHYGPERSTSGGGDWDRDSTFYYMRHKEVNQPTLREASLGPSPQLAPLTSLQRFLAKIWTLGTFPTTNASTFVSSQNSPRLAWPPYSNTLKVCP